MNQVVNKWLFALELVDLARLMCQIVIYVYLKASLAYIPGTYQEVLRDFYLDNNLQLQDSVTALCAAQ